MEVGVPEKPAHHDMSAHVGYVLEYLLDVWQIVVRYLADVLPSPQFSSSFSFVHAPAPPDPANNLESLCCADIFWVSADI
jgi:hypothetical protein